MIVKLYEQDTKDGTRTVLASINTDRFGKNIVGPVVDVHGDPVHLYNPFGPDPESPESMLYVEVIDE